MKRYTPVLLLTGYLGSGKTTLLNRILSNSEGIKFAVIVNDIGEVNIDADLIQKEGVVGGNGSDDLVALQNGCICCTLSADLMRQLSGLCDGKFDYIVIEASGVCEPAPIARTIMMMQEAEPEPEYTGTLPRLDSIVCVVDALRLKTDFKCGASLKEESAVNGKSEEDARIEGLVMEQIEFCNKILLNKIDEVSEEDKEEIKSVIRAIQSEAEIIETKYCDVNMTDILDTHSFDFEKTATSATWVKKIEEHAEEEHHHHHHEHENHNGECCNHHDHDNCHCHDHNHEHDHLKEFGIETAVYFRRAPFDFDKFDRYVNLEWPDNVIRTKGVVYFSHNTDMSLLFEQAGQQKNLREAGLWLATAPEEELRAMIEQDPSILRDWDEVYGDRMIKLVFIGRHLQCETLFGKLDQLLAKKSR